MKFFTPAWLSGELHDEEADRVREEYRAHLDARTGMPGLAAGQ